jgi:hypothetical protein
VWVFGGLAQVEDDDEAEGQVVYRLKPTNELWSFDVTLMLWSWLGCEVRCAYKRRKWASEVDPREAAFL